MTRARPRCELTGRAAEEAALALTWELPADRARVWLLSGPDEGVQRVRPALLVGTRAEVVTALLEDIGEEEWPSEWTLRAVAADATAQTAASEREAILALGEELFGRYYPHARVEVDRYMAAIRARGGKSNG